MSYCNSRLIRNIVPFLQRYLPPYRQVKPFEGCFRMFLLGMLVLSMGLISLAVPVQAQSNRKLNAIENRLQLLENLLREVTAENKALRETLERMEIEALRLEQEFKNELQEHAKSQVVWRDEVDKLRLQITVMEQLLRSPLAGVPDVTVADKLFRRGLSQIINGQLDVGVRDLADFRRRYPKDVRLSQVLHYQGQALFLLHQCEGAMEPLFALLDNQPQYRRVADVRWLLASCLEDVGEPLRARRFYAELVASGGAWTDDATRRLQFLDQRYGKSSRSKR